MICSLDFFIGSLDSSVGRIGKYLVHMLPYFGSPHCQQKPLVWWRQQAHYG